MGNKKQENQKPIQAAALKYERTRDKAPRLAARGEGKIAEKIIELAKEHGVPITQDPDLLTILSKMQIGSTINPAIYEIVAELLVFIYRLKEKWVEQEQTEEL